MVCACDAGMSDSLIPFLLATESVVYVIHTLQLLAAQRIRHKLRAEHVHRPEESAWARIRSVGDDDAWMEVTGYTKHAVHVLFNLLAPVIPRHDPIAGGRPPPLGPAHSDDFDVIFSPHNGCRKGCGFGFRLSAFHGQQVYSLLDVSV